MSLSDVLWSSGFTPPLTGYVGVSPKFSLLAAPHLTYPYPNRPAIVIPTTSGGPFVAGDNLFTVYDTFTLQVPESAFGPVAYLHWIGNLSEYYQSSWPVKAQAFATLRYGDVDIAYATSEFFTGTLDTGVVVGGWNFDIMAGWGHLALNLPPIVPNRDYELQVGAAFYANGSFTHGSNTWTFQSTYTEVAARYKTHGLAVSSQGAVKKAVSGAVVSGGVLKDVSEIYVVKSGVLSPIIDLSIY